MNTIKTARFLLNFLNSNHLTTGSKKRAVINARISGIETGKIQYAINKNIAIDIIMTNDLLENKVANRNLLPKKTPSY